MVSPIYIVAILLGVGFLLPSLSKAGTKITGTIFFAALIAVAAISYQWLTGFLLGDQVSVMIYTAGFKPPISINLQMGLFEAIFIGSINFMALFGAIYMFKQMAETGARSFVLFLLMVLGLNGLVMTRDIFNLFVFLEITSIATYSLIGMDLKLKSLSAGFKYMLAGGIASVFLLLGIIILYSVTGTLNIDEMVTVIPAVVNIKLLSIGLFILLFSLIIEMKQFPANGWAIDSYEGVAPGLTGLVAAIGTAGVFFGIYKTFPMMSRDLLTMTAVIGMMTFFVSNLMGLKQKNPRRILGYSSVAQMGLILSVGAWAHKTGGAQDKIFMLVLIPLFLNHFFAKAGLFWIAGIVKSEKYKNWGILRNNKVLLIPFILLVLALIGLPPFPGFWGKWNLVLFWGANKSFIWIWFLLIGSLLEAVYMLRWLGYVLKSEKTEEEEIKYDPSISKNFAVLLATSVLLTIAVYYSWTNEAITPMYYLPFTVGLGLFYIPFFSAKIKGFISMAAIAAYGYYFLPDQAGFTLFFNALFLGGSFVLLIATMHSKGKRVGFYPLLMLMIGSLVAMVESANTLQFFFAWEIMTVSSYFLVMRGKKAQKAALRYAIFSLGGAFSILLGFAYAFSEMSHSFVFPISLLGAIEENKSIVFILITLGFLVKLAAIGLHTWLGGAYKKSEDDFTAFMSAILSKAGVFGLVILILIMGIPKIGNIDIAYVLGWIGAITAISGTMIAIFQEDAKKLLAYSSMGQLGYIIMGLAAMTSLGWTAGMYQVVNHMLIKGVLFLAIAGVIYRTGTSKMYQMGGLIKKMPLSYTAVMFGIIAISGVPPLSGFGAKWLLYEALIEKGWYLQTGVAFFASTVAFLYCFRLIHSIFLGQAKTEFRDVKEAPLWFIVPQYIFIIVIMFISMKPKYLLDWITGIIKPIYGQSLTWVGDTAFTSLGYWNGFVVMNIVMVLFIGLTILLLIKAPKVQKVKQFNIVFAAERPETPELTHYAYRFFKPYHRALGFLVTPRVKTFWKNVSSVTHTLAGSIRKIYTGNGQTYAFWILLYGLVLFFITVGAK
ncbi:MAG: proton-conducting transporter membrane subunit [Candidatus Delongbacteria bacterium]|jgi:formate hydrogenlyase subunit 3/multisubunit Na+/H+ antiporter MnhD subunit|nr:proton-conducting transporter membrane subunit [Candidatus Delongbacteria bacterium]